MNITRQLLFGLAFVLLGAVNLHAEEKRFVAEVIDGLQKVEILGGGYFFEPNWIVLKRGVPVELRARKEAGFVPHDMVVSAADAGIEFSLALKKDWQIVKFTPTKVGTYPLECQKRLLWFESHKDRGMKGVIEVVP